MDEWDGSQKEQLKRKLDFLIFENISPEEKRILASIVLRFNKDPKSYFTKKERELIEGLHTFCENQIRDSWYAKPC